MGSASSASMTFLGVWAASGAKVPYIQVYDEDFDEGMVKSFRKSATLCTHQ